MKTVLVTGGAGFIGSHLCEQLLKKKMRVLCVDNFFVGSEENIGHLLKNNNFVVIEHDIIEPLHLEEHVDQIYNFACPASPMHYQYDPIFTLETSVIGTKNMLELARKNNARILHASTSEVYGDPHVHPQPESYWGNVNPIGVRACYDEGKRAAETLCFDYNREHEVDLRVIRIFNTYGPRMAVGDGRVVSNFIMQALQNEPITMYGDGAQSRSFQYIDDLVRGIFAMMEQEEFIGPVNLGNPNEFTIAELAQKVIALTKSTSEIVINPLPKDDPKQRKPDITLAQKKLHWKPEIQLEEGLKKTIAYFKTKASKKTSVAIFTPAFFPLEGLQEEFVRSVTENIKSMHFDIFVPGEKSGVEKEEKNNTTIYRIGGKGIWSKLRFPWRAAKLANELGEKCNYVAIWGVMGGIGGMAAHLLKKQNPRYPVFLSLDSNELRETCFTPKGFFHFITRRLAQASASYTETFEADGTLSLQELFSKQNASKDLDYLEYRFRQLFYRLSLEKEFGRSFVMKRRIFNG